MPQPFPRNRGLLVPEDSGVDGGGLTEPPEVTQAVGILCREKEKRMMSIIKAEEPTSVTYNLRGKSSNPTTFLLSNHPNLFVRQFGPIKGASNTCAVFEGGLVE